MIAYFIIAIAVALRILDHVTGFAFFPPNFAPIGALALFAGAYMVGNKAYFIPLGALVLSDLVIGFYNPFVMFSVYGSFVLVALLGKALKTKRDNALYIGGAAVTSAVLFFIITNFAVWAAHLAIYTPTWEGLMAVYVAGIPFFKYTLAGDIFFTGIFFLSFEAAKSLLKHYQDKQNVAIHS